MAAAHTIIDLEESNSSCITGVEYSKSSSSSTLETSLTSPVSPIEHKAIQDVRIGLEDQELSESTDSQQDSRYIALGTIKLVRRFSLDSTIQWFMQGHHSLREYPMPIFNMATKKGWIKLDPHLDNLQPRVHVYALPEDVDRTDRGPLKEFHKTIIKLLEFVDRSEDAWNGILTDRTMAEPYEAPLSQNDESLFYIFNTLRSPSPNLNSIQYSTNGYNALYDVIHDSIVGLKTKLYSYQRRSVAAMVQRESEPAKLIDPRLVLTKGVDGQPFYLDVYNGNLLKTPNMYTEPRGGILAETMGYGKTLICIALILATRGHYPRIPEGVIDDIQMKPQKKVGTLLNLAAATIKHKGVAWKSHFNELKKRGYHHDRCLHALSQYNRSYSEAIFTPTTPNRAGKMNPNKQIHLCYATLIIVPPNLIAQWLQEIHKHVEADTLDILIIDLSTQAIPSWQELLTCDILLMTKSRFEQEYRDDDLNQGRRAPGIARYESPLTQVRWLRVICDEGHSFAGSSCKTNAMAMLDKMYIERRWVVSGTPSSTLHGVEVGLSTTSSATDMGSADRRSSIKSTLEQKMAPEVLSTEARDMERLRIMVVRFLRLQPWANRGDDTADWKRYLAPVEKNGNRRVPMALREVLQTLIIRHRIEDIDTDLALPPLHTRVVYLQPSYHDKLALNMFVLTLVSNYVTSEREDQDYMFHPKNRKIFDVLVNNLRQATFHWVGFTDSDVRATLRVSDEYLDKNLDKINDHDGLLLTQAIINAQQALDDPSWMAFSKLHEIGVFVNHFPKLAKQAWALDGQGDSPTLLGTVQAREAQKFFKDQAAKGVQDPLSGLVGKGMKIMRAARDNAEKESDASKMSLADTQRQLGMTEEPRLRAVGSSIQKTTVSPKKSPAKSPRKRKHAELIKDETLTPDPAVMAAVKIPPTTVSGFTSSKLAYLINELLQHSPTSKSIVFYSSNSVAFWTAEALELMRIPFLIYANTLSVAARSKYLTQFNTDDSIRVLLMDLKQASYGLHIASANRVYIISPIWDKAVESQAIKRAHRIGQTKEVFVETLVLEGTFEEEMIKRRHDIDRYGRDATNSPEVTICDDEGMAEQMNLDDARATLSRDPSVSNDKAFSKRYIPYDYTQPRRRPPPPRNHGTVQQRSQSLLDDSHMVRVLKDINFLEFTKEELQSAGARVARLDVQREKRMFFSVDTQLAKDAGAGGGENSTRVEGKTAGVLHTGISAKTALDNQGVNDQSVPVRKKARFA